MKKVIKYLLYKLGFQIQRVSNRSSYFTMEGALKRCIERGLNVNTVIDIGASTGRWSKMCMKHLPQANYLLVEANLLHEKELIHFKKDLFNVDYVLAAAAKDDGEIYFDNRKLFGGVGSETPFRGYGIVVPAISIDNEIRRRNLKPPYLIKLDTHGFEVPILEGASETVKSAELIIIETYNYQLGGREKALKYFQMSEYMEKLGFSSVEMVNFGLRSYDNSFWQMDTFYIPSSNKIFSYRYYE